MSVSGIFSSSFASSQIDSQSQLTNSQFQQLGKDLGTGNLSAAQSDFAALATALTASSTVSTASTSNPVGQTFQQLATDLKSGNLSGAKQDYATLQQDLQNLTAKLHFHHHHHKGGASTGSVLDSSQQSTNSTAALQSYATLQQLLTGDGTQSDGTTAGTTTGGQHAPEPPIEKRNVSFLA